MAVQSTLAPIKRIASDKRITSFPIVRQNLWKFFEVSQKLFWTQHDFKGAQDVVHYQNATPAERHVLDAILAFFASSDNLVNVNIAERFKNEVGIYEADLYYNFQIIMEDIHAITYSMIIDTIVTDAEKRKSLFDAVQQIPVISKIAQWITDTTESDKPFAERLLRMIAVEGVLFIGCFCIIYWFGSRGLFPGICAMNRLIARDESSHTMFAIEIYHMLQAEHKLSTEKIHTIMREAAKIAHEFTEYALPNALPGGMNIKLVDQYIEHQIDVIMSYMKVPIIFGSENPFAFMEKINMNNQAFFFEVPVVDYSQVSEEVSDDITDDF